ncbi:MAG: type II toxin-antitoxin system Phd/YefM family antitoxin [Propionibacteriaceae bacterium]|nr:type II toxin-antitoxin system Phd/YefM family antitoxin [Propionibacteriaceae bacterium]
MIIVNMLEAKTQLSKLVEAIENGSEEEIFIARNGRPVARLVSLPDREPSALLGIAQGQFEFDKNTFDSLDEEVADMFGIPQAKELSKP